VNEIPKMALEVHTVRGCSRYGSNLFTQFPTESGQMKFVLGIVLGLLVAGTAFADSTWVYTGNTMNGYVFSEQSFGAANCNCALDGTVTLDASGNAVAWDFDGTHTLTNLNSTGAIDPFEQSSTPFATWFVSLSGGGNEFFSQFTGSAGEATDFSTTGGMGFGYEEGNHGTWALDSVGAAEPATGLLVGLGLAVVGLMRRRKKKPFENTVWENLG
jgi:hypothetical protein